MTESFDWHKEAEVQWDGRAGFWNERSKTMWDDGSRKDIIPFIEKHLQKENSILDIGCGDGYGTYRLHKSGYIATGMDLSNEMISKARERLNQNEIHFIQGDISNMPFSDGSFDAVMAINVLEWTEKPAVALQELFRVLKRGGTLYCGILGPAAGPRANSYPRLHGEKAICNTMMPWEFEKLAADYNFTYLDGFGVYKEGVKPHHHEGLSPDLRQALSFLWLFMLRKEGE
ncbi:class I SAM-dependent methyltransferase [Virgibacillus ihumii]|uniref:class I SAM-dependent methyltransferase n=1 Tax=Virgibacillus ihumii TaxID=2686091 RepID=UPI00157BBCB4|nr:class I SAM-dependent methyltransferase [Virgibacillus ihumii]